jgi:hypothetical protein
MSYNPRYASDAGIVGRYYLKSLLDSGYNSIAADHIRVNETLNGKN